MQTKRLQFLTIQERDEYICLKYPERECTDVPGLYRVPKGYLSVFCETVEFIPEENYQW